MLKQQKTFVIAFAIAFVVMLVLYFAVVAPLLVEEAEVVAPTETQEGEALGTNSRYLMFPQVARANIQSLEVHNASGTYTFYRNTADNFVLKGYEGIVAYDEELFSSLAVSAGYTLAMMKVTDDATPEEMAEYGLDTPQAYWILTTTDGDIHQVNVGDILVTEGGYYCSYEGRDAVYILSTSLASTILQPIEVLITPVLTAGMSTNDYFEADDFYIMHGDQLFLSIVQKDKSEYENSGSLVENKMKYPAPYTINTSLHTEILYSFINLVGTETVKLSPTDEELELFGLYDPAYTISYSFKDMTFYLFVSALQPDGTYYATSNLSGYNVIAKVDASLLGFLEYSLFKWLSPYPFQATITNVKEITLLSGDGSTDLVFTLQHGVTDGGTNTLEVDVNNGVHIPNSDVYNFRQLYKTLLSVVMEEYTPLTEEERTALTEDPSKLLLTFTYTDINGVRKEYKFYQYTTRRVFMTINGVGEFYTIPDYMEKILNDAERLLEGIDIDSYGKN